MIEQVIQQRNLNKVYQQVCANKGAGGVDGMEISQLNAHLQTHGRALVARIRNGSYQLSPTKGVEIPKSNGKRRMLGIPTLTDRVIQQALHQAGEPVFEMGFQRHSYGFRPNRNAHQAVQQAQRNINESYQHVIDIDLKSFFDQVDHAILLELVHRIGKRGHRYVRYADDFSIYVRSKTAARRVGNSIYDFPLTGRKAVYAAPQHLTYWATILSRIQKGGQRSILTGGECEKLENLQGQAYRTDPQSHSHEF